MRLRWLLAVTAAVLPALMGAATVPAYGAEDVMSTDADIYPESSPDAALTTKLEVVHRFTESMPRGVAVSPDGRVFVCFPHHDKDGPYCLAELKDGAAVPYPNDQISTANVADVPNHFVSIMAARVDINNRLWVLDSGRQGRTAIAGGARLLAIDLATGKIVKTISFQPDVLLPASVLKDFRIDLQVGKEGVGIIADSAPQGKNGIIVVDLATGKAKRRLDGHYSVTPEPDYVVFAQGEMVRFRFDADSRVDFTAGVAGLAISGDGKYLFYSPMAGLKLFRVPIARLCDFAVPDAALDKYVEMVGRKIGSSDGIESDTAGGLYVTDVENNMIWHRRPDGVMEKLVRHELLLWPDRLCLSNDGYLYIVASQFNRGPWFHFGQDLRARPFNLLRIKVDAKPVRLAPLAVNMDPHVGGASASKAVCPAGFSAGAANTGATKIGANKSASGNASAGQNSAAGGSMTKAAARAAKVVVKQKYIHK
jgi:sugar lactone lactonase YvrE